MKMYQLPDAQYIRAKPKPPNLFKPNNTLNPNTAEAMSGEQDVRWLQPYDRDAFFGLLCSVTRYR